MEGFIRAIFARSATFSHFYILAQLLFVGNGCANRRWVDRVSLLVDNVRFVLTWRLRDGIGGLSPGMNDQEDKAGSCCGLRRMWRYHQPLPPLIPSAVCCVHHVLSPLSKCTSQLGAFSSSHTFPASCIHSWALQPKDKKKAQLGVSDHIGVCDCETAWMNVLPTPWLSIWTSAEFTECRS